MTAPVGPPSVTDGGTSLFAWLRQMRDRHPVWRDSYGMYHVFRYDDVRAVLADHERFSSDRTRLMGRQPFGQGGITMIDPPEHRHQRRLITAAFTPGSIAALEPRIAAITDELLDALPGPDFDLVESLAYPLPVTVVAELLGVPPSDRDLFRTWSDRLMSLQVPDFADPSLAGRVAAAMAEMNDYLREHCADRRTRPRDDLLTRLVHAEIDGERLDAEQVVNTASLLLLAGHVTTTVLIGNTVLCLADTPEATHRIRADMSLIPQALEESMRLRSPFMQAGRVTTQDVRVAGETIPANRFVMAWLLSANHDERHFADPERFDLDRQLTGQLAFGHGVHFCLGAQLGRLEGRIALERLLSRFTELRPEKRSFYESQIFGVREMHVRGSS
ncbi:cytochrome P450 [Nonomuraea sp. NPDC051941]|uniref:cytochrome P450 n=1 Tax=Nonomuraea sp. NPDC051941 TaxID=3364373 RepID=UPI0037C5FCDB